MELTDQQIKDFINEPKPLPEGFLNWNRARVRKGSYHIDYEIIGELGSEFVLHVRKNTFDENNFSIVLCVIIGGISFILRRYNGYHEHTNRIERSRFTDYHIHTATLRYQRIKGDVEGYAEETDRYSTIEQALECMILDCKMYNSQYDERQSTLF